MTLLFFLEWGKHGLGFMWVLWAGLSGFIGYKAYKSRENSTTRVLDDELGNRRVLTNQPKLSWWNVPEFRILLLTQLAFIVIHLVIVAEG